MEGLSILEFQEFLHQIGELRKSTLFDQEGNLRENRPEIFRYLEAVIGGSTSLSRAFGSMSSGSMSLSISKRRCSGTCPNM